jgi:hypothetical protein
MREEIHTRSLLIALVCAFPISYAFSRSSEFQIFFRPDWRHYARRFEEGNRKKSDGLNPNFLLSAVQLQDQAPAAKSNAATNL